MMKVTKDTILQRSYRLGIHLEGSEVRLTGSQGEIEVNGHILAILDVFATPKTLDQGMQILNSRAQGRQDWIALTNQVMALCHRGWLAAPSPQAVTLPTHPGKFSAADVHLRMLHDRARTVAFQRALYAQVKPDDVVVDIGTGTGILAATAALAGACQVYGVERTGNLSRLAQQFFAHNGLSDRVQVIEGDSTRVTLPEKADVLVTETIGNDPLGEGILATVADAHQRLLKPNARLIPNRLRIYALPVTMPERRRGQVLFTPELVLDWRQTYGLDFSSYVDFCAGQSFHSLVKAQTVRDWPRLSAPLLVAEVDLHQPPVGEFSRQHRLRFNQDGELNAMLVYFEADLGGGEVLSVHPDQATPENSWASYLWVAGTAIEVRRDQILEITYQWQGNQSRFEFTDPPRAEGVAVS
ncbi:MAG: 50S ribosomal protein L11 methyltransferase [Nodosilinea sp.]